VQALVGTGSLLRLALRRDRWLLPVIALGFAGVAASTVSSTASLYPDEAGRVEAAVAMNGTASLVALYGRIYDPTSLGALAVIKLSAFGASLLALVIVALVIRHTRVDEESGRLESLPRAGRAAPLVAALVVGMGTAAVTGLLTSFGLLAAGLPVAGSLAFGLAWGATGIAFAAVAGLVAQVTASARTARGLAMAAVAVTYVLRALGDLDQPSWATWLSPIGWNQQVRAFAGDRLAVIVLPLVVAVALVPLAVALRNRRDLGAGVVADRPGPDRGRLRTAVALAWRLQARSLLTWLVGFVAVGAILGSLAGDIEGLFTSDQIVDLITTLGGTRALTDAVLSAYVVFAGIAAGAYAIAATARLRAEESAGHVDLLLTRPVTRSGWAAGHLLIALVGALLLLLAFGLGAGIAAAVSLSDPAQVGRVLVAAAVQAPAAWVMSALVVLLFGWAPRATLAAWGVLIAVVLLAEFGPLWNVPAAVLDLSPFAHVPRLPVSSGAAGLVGLVGVAALLSVSGLWGWRRRDVQP
jgi:ABC-2 type transport system permease protein